MGRDDRVLGPDHLERLRPQGLRRYGFRDQASELVAGLFEAAASFDYQLPEVFAGYARSDTTIPVEYPTASCPLAWAAAALLGLRTVLGLDASHDGL